MLFIFISLVPWCWFYNGMSFVFFYKTNFNHSIIFYILLQLSVSFKKKIQNHEDKLKTTISNESIEIRPKEDIVVVLVKSLSRDKFTRSDKLIGFYSFSSNWFLYIYPWFLLCNTLYMRLLIHDSITKKKK